MRKQSEAFDGARTVAVRQSRDEPLDAFRIEDRARLLDPHARRRQPDVHPAAVLGVAEPDDIALAFEAIDRALTAIDRNTGIKVVADWVVLQL